MSSNNNLKSLLLESPDRIIIKSKGIVGHFREDECVSFMLMSYEGKGFVCYTKRIEMTHYTIVSALGELCDILKLKFDIRERDVREIFSYGEDGGEEYRERLKKVYAAGMKHLLSRGIGIYGDIGVKLMLDTNLSEWFCEVDPRKVGDLCGRLWKDKGVMSFWNGDDIVMDILGRSELMRGFMGEVYGKDRMMGVYVELEKGDDSITYGEILGGKGKDSNLGHDDLVKRYRDDIVKLHVLPPGFEKEALRKKLDGLGLVFRDKDVISKSNDDNMPQFRRDALRNVAEGFIGNYRSMMREMYNFEVDLGS